jgi:chitodextrinase
VPQGVTAIAGDRQVELHWTAVSADDLGGYVVYRSSPGDGWTTAARVTGTNALISGLSNGSQYWFAVSSVDTTGNESAWSAQAPAVPLAPADTTAPPSPASLVATAGDGEATLAWSAVDAPDLAGYLVYRRVAPDGEWLRLSEAPTIATVLTVSDLVNGTPYEFVVTAVDASGNESVASPAASATPRVAPVDPE